MNPTDTSKNKITAVGIVGLGYVGLPLAKGLVDVGITTIGFDTDYGKIEKLRAGHSYINHLPKDWIKEAVKAGKFIPTDDMSRLGEADAILICVPTPLNETRDPDLSYVIATTEAIAAKLRRGQLIVLESTSYPGTTRDVMLPILAKSGLSVGEDFFLAYSPEREDPGNKSFTTTTIPKVIGAIDRASLQFACRLYEQIFENVVPVSSCEVAEACKLLENTYRAVNIALVNELKRLLTKMGIDVWEVIEAAKTKPFGYQAFYPGPGLGGHCIPIDPFYLSWIARKYNTSMRFIELAGEINRAMPEYVIERLSHALNELGKSVNGSKICLLGVAYKADVDDVRESPFFELYTLLSERGAGLSYSDPHVPALPAMRHYNLPKVESVELTAAFLAQQDCILIVTNHTAFDYQFILEHSRLIIDTRNATRLIESDREKIMKT